jgi:hypothetical protein
MRNNSKIIPKLACVVMALLLLGNVSHALDDPDGPDCRSGKDAATAVPPADSAGAGATAKPHRVKLKWDPSATARTPGVKLVAGYNIYRREQGATAVEQINLKPIDATRCVDYAVKAGQTYFYQAKTVGSNGKVSVPSNEATATIKSP